ncbi:MAG: T9SS type A sorting domain-containing protein [Chitinophagaceae bacterium]|nr:T9SS type A sorting domain-containing protein [Chitinophagaceae bacterium]
MKQCYPSVPSFLGLAILLFYLPSQLNAQCLCENGNVPQTITYQQTRNIRPIDDSTNFDIMQFNPDMGQLVCANVFSYITGVVRMRLENDEIYPVSYRINYQRTDQISGPGLTPPISSNFTKNYGPYNLAASDGSYFSGPDFVAIGPDTVLKAKYLSRNVTGSLVPFLGYGTVRYNYKVSGRTTVTGSINYIFSVSSQDFVTIGITYSFCPTGLLGTDIKDFAASRKTNEDVQLSWTTVNETKGNQYEIELSKTGSDFETVAKIAANTATGSTASKYEVPYHLTQPGSGYMYFRIKQTTTAGKVSHTPIRSVVFEANKTGFSIYPNPTRTKVQMQFDEAVNGNFNIDIVNIAGQIVHSRQLTLKENISFSFNLPAAPPAGVYYLRAKEVNGSRTFSGKLIIQAN